MHNIKIFLRAALLLAVAVSASSILAQAQTLTTIHSFTGNHGDGEQPYPQNLPIDSNGAIYGTTVTGGSTQWGTVFQLVPPTKQGGAWTENVIYTFAGGADGAFPQSGVVLDQNGNLYGTTSEGGISQYTPCGGGCGTVFELSPPAQPGGPWTHTVLYAFQGSYDGQRPGEVAFGPNGLLYGITSDGGTPAFPCKPQYPRIKYGCGTVFQLTPPGKKGGGWTKTILYTFPGATNDGLYPDPDVTFDSLGNLYGMTGSGGTAGTAGYGIVFQLTPHSKETVLYDFTGGSDGGYPGEGVVLGANGVLYGTDSYSGALNASGVVFQLTPPTSGGGAWTETVLHTFPAFGGDGTTPVSTLALDPSGNLYGTTDYGGSTGCGTVFKLAPPSGAGAWTETVLQDWACANTGSANESRVVYHNGLLYGTTVYLGSADLGQAFTLVP